MSYRWNRMGFEAPEGRDESSVLIVDPTDPPRWNLDVRVDVLHPRSTDALAAYVDAQERPKGVVVDRRDQREVAGRTATILDLHFELEDRSVLRQQQAFIPDGARVVVATMTARGGAHKQSQAAFDRLLDTFQFDEVTQ